jgi:hypothetical protein
LFSTKQGYVLTKNFNNMGLLIFGILLIVGGGIAIGVLIREPRDLLSIGCKIWIAFVISTFMFWGFFMVMHNDIVFDKHIKVYNNGDYRKEILYDTNGNELKVKYKITNL